MLEYKSEICNESVKTQRAWGSDSIGQQLRQASITKTPDTTRPN